jgi:hypothetical protein
MEVGTEMHIADVEGAYRRVVANQSLQTSQIVGRGGPCAKPPQKVVQIGGLLG